MTYEVRAIQESRSNNGNDMDCISPNRPFFSNDCEMVFFHQVTEREISLEKPRHFLANFNDENALIKNISCLI